ncbi:hypothetical protein [Paraclostridium bifermentans]
MRRDKYELGERIRDRICLSQIAGWLIEFIIPMALLFLFLKYVEDVPFRVALHDLWKWILGIALGWTVLRLIILKHLLTLWDEIVEEERTREYEDNKD